MLQAAVIGLGRIGLMYDTEAVEGRPGSHAYAYHLHPDINLVAGVGVRPAQGEALAQLAPEAAFYLSLDQMLANHKLDIVSICTPSYVRYELIETVLRESQPRILFCEKPIAKSVEEARRIQSLMAAYPDCKLIPNLSRRWNAGIAKIRDKIIQRTYGKLIKLHLRYTRGVFNSGSHLFDLVRHFAGLIDEVCVLQRIPSRMDVEEDWTFTFTFSAGEGEVSGYAEAFNDEDDLYIFEMDLFFERGKVELLEFGDRIRYYGVREHPLMKGMRILDLEEEESGVLRKSNNMSNAVDHIVRVALQGDDPICNIEDGIYPLLVAESLLGSYDSNGGKLLVK